MCHRGRRHVEDVLHPRSPGGVEELLCAQNVDPLKVFAASGHRHLGGHVNDRVLTLDCPLHGLRVVREPRTSRTPSSPEALRWKVVTVYPSSGQPRAALYGPAARRRR